MSVAMLYQIGTPLVLLGLLIVGFANIREPMSIPIFIATFWISLGLGMK